MEGDHRGSDAPWMFFGWWWLALNSCPCFCTWICSQSLNHSAEGRLGETQSRGGSDAAVLPCVGICRSFLLRIKTLQVLHWGWTCSWLEFQSRARLSVVGAAII